MHHRKSFCLSPAALAVALALLPASSSQAQTYDAVSDFTGTSPSGTWSYLWSSSPGGTLAPLTVPVSFTSQMSGLTNGQGNPNGEYLMRNYGPGTADYLTIVDPTNLLDLGLVGGEVDARWTAPATADYSISGLFQMIDTDAKTHEIQIVQDDATSSPLLDDLLTNPSFGQQVPFSYTEQLNAGETLDFIADDPAGDDYHNLSTGLSATISVVVPEPASMSLLMLSAPLLLSRRRAIA